MYVLSKRFSDFLVVQDYSNPITQFAMQDYPVSSGDGMKQAFNTEKMLIDIPSEMATQTVHVDGELFYLNKLLQQKSGEYFIPECFFFAKTSDQEPLAGALSEGDLYALGHEVEKSDVSPNSIRYLGFV